MWLSGQRTRPPCAVDRDALCGRGSRLSPAVFAYQRIIRSTPPSRPNKAGLKGPSARPSTKSFFDFNDIRYVGSGRHKYSYIRDKRSRVESYPYTVKEGQRYINLNPDSLFVQQPPKRKKGSRGSYKLLR